ncbi:MAG: hypothetical protein A3H98_05495 [Bacteroidetes bacterium RIFCSPLOWO2_02_FULL_36_8]|nr:MAG: hypothetical protein A3H98_05495 [Bacteroidetes bacterium RIFCSPLOWO2_02_FULL_36_8]OFY70281.1 MAG: hypothetical protein A3G23_09095 [Bacteroidetes bacterium RIFCSPLOWO2_12_FULL_37_12]
MKINYKFTWDSEPTDKQLHSLMKGIAIDAKKKTEKAYKLFWKQLDKEVEQARKKWSVLIPQHK